MNQVMVEDLNQKMRRAGWLCGAPNAHAELMDRPLCENSNCPRCRAHGMAYKPFYKLNGYRAFKVCRACGFVEEL